MTAGYRIIHATKGRYRKKAINIRKRQGYREDERFRAPRNQKSGLPASGSGSALSEKCSPPPSLQEASGIGSRHFPACCTRFLGVQRGSRSFAVLPPSISSPLLP